MYELARFISETLLEEFLGILSLFFSKISLAVFPDLIPNIHFNIALKTHEFNAILHREK